MKDLFERLGKCKDKRLLGFHEYSAKNKIDESFYSPMEIATFYKLLFFYNSIYRYQNDLMKGIQQEFTGQSGGNLLIESMPHDLMKYLTGVPKWSLDISEMHGARSIVQFSSDYILTMPKSSLSTMDEYLQGGLLGISFMGDVSELTEREREILSVDFQYIIKGAIEIFLGTPVFDHENAYDKIKYWAFVLLTINAMRDCYSQFRVNRKLIKKYCQ